MQMMMMMIGNHSQHRPSEDMGSRDVLYSCGACGYQLNLCSSQRDVTEIDSKYSKAMKKGSISFLSIDESRVKQEEELVCNLTTKLLWGGGGGGGFHRLRIRLLCGSCRKVIGYANGHDVDDTICSSSSSSSISSSSSGVLDSSDSSSDYGGVVVGQRKYYIKIKALQPSEDMMNSPNYSAPSTTTTIW